MRDPWSPLYALGITAVILPLVVWRGRVVQRRAAENLRAIAARLGLDFQPARSWSQSASLSGKLRGRPADLFTYTTGSGKSRRKWAAISVRAADWKGLTFKLQKQGLNTKISEWLGAHEIVVGDSAFDAAWFVQTNQPDFLRAALLPEVREKLMAVRRAGAEGRFELTNGEVKYIEPDQLSRRDGIDLFVAVAEVVTDLAELAELAGSHDGLG